MGRNTTGIDAPAMHMISFFPWFSRLLPASPGDKTNLARFVLRSRCCLFLASIVTAAAAEAKPPIHCRNVGNLSLAERRESALFSA